MSKPARADKPKAKGKREGALPRHGNRSIVVAVSLLRVIASLGRPATLTEIASAARMSAPRAHRYLLGLANTRLVEHSTISGRYDLGSEIVELGVAALGKVDAVRFASEALTPLAEKTGLAAIITVWGTNGPTVIRCEHAELASAVRVREGRNLSLLLSASGRIFLTYLPNSLVAPFVARELKAADKGLPKSEAVNKELDALRAEVRKHGLGRGIGEETSAVAVLAAPVFGANGRLALSIALVSSVGGFDTSYKGEPAKALKQAAAELSRRLGYSGNGNAKAASSG
jgi:DNA-binding IclR family transcriptional regulator